MPMSLPTITIVLALSIPIIAILGGLLKDYLEFKATHQGLGADTEALESELESVRERLDVVEDERDALVRRLQNLETIVTSDAWDALPESQSELKPEPGLDQEELNVRDGEKSEQAADDLARRLRSR